VAPTYNPARRQRSGGLWFKASWANSSLKSLSRKNPSQKRAGGVAQCEGPEFKPQYYKQTNIVLEFVETD
jgi:hypothetical protein